VNILALNAILAGRKLSRKELQKKLLSLANRIASQLLRRERDPSTTG